MQTTGCYNLVGNNTFTYVSLANQFARVAPPQARIEFQFGEVLAFRLETALNTREPGFEDTTSRSRNTKSHTGGSNGGVVLLKDSVKQGDSGYETEEVWYADFCNPVFGTGDCQLAVGSQSDRTLNTKRSAAPVLSVSYSELIFEAYSSITVYNNYTHAKEGP